MTRLKLASLAAAALMATAAGTQAAPVVPSAAQQGLSVQASDVTTVQYRRGGGYRYYAAPRRYGGWRGPAIGLGIGSALVAGAIIANRSYAPRQGYYYDTYAYDGPYYYPEDYRGDPRDICARHFRSFEWRTGMYTTYGGERRLCPYLR